MGWGWAGRTGFWLEKGGKLRAWEGGAGGWGLEVMEVGVLRAVGWVGWVGWGAGRAGGGQAWGWAELGGTVSGWLKGAHEGRGRVGWVGLGAGGYEQEGGD